MTAAWFALGSAYFIVETAMSALEHISAKKAGALGGLFASGVQFWSTTLNDVVTAAFAWEKLAVTQGVAFVLGTLGFAFFGGLFAYFLQDYTKSRLAWFLAGALATSTPVNAIPGLLKFIQHVDLSPISSAYADEAQSAKSCDDIRNFTVVDGLKQFFGIDEPGYRVVIGSFKRFDEAENLANKLRNEKPGLIVFVGDKAPCNDFYPVIIGQTSSTLYAAKKIQAQAQQLSVGANAYISNRGSR